MKRLEKVLREKQHKALCTRPPDAGQERHAGRWQARSINTDESQLRTIEQIVQLPSTNLVGVKVFERRTARQALESRSDHHA